MFSTDETSEEVSASGGETNFTAIETPPKAMLDEEKPVVTTTTGHTQSHKDEGLDR